MPEVVPEVFGGNNNLQKPYFRRHYIATLTFCNSTLIVIQWTTKSLKGSNNSGTY